jgi:hypothetical protein
LPSRVTQRIGFWSFVEQVRNLSSSQGAQFERALASLDRVVFFGQRLGIVIRRRNLIARCPVRARVIVASAQTKRIPMKRSW